MKKLLAKNSTTERFGPLTKALPLLLVFMLLFSCEDQSFDPAGADSHDRIISFQGVKVNHTFDVPEEALYYSEDQIASLYIDEINKLNPSERTYTSLYEVDLPSWEVLGSLIKKEQDKYPIFHGEDEDVRDQIRRNFIGMSDEEITSNASLILRYYEKNLAYDVFSKMANYASTESTSSNSRMMNLGYSPTPCESSWINSNILYAQAAADARTEAYDLSNAQYPGLCDHWTKKDAFRHGIWNILMGKKFGWVRVDLANIFAQNIHNEVITEVINLANELAAAHEECSGCLIWDCEMDYRNNYNGIEHFRNTASISGWVYFKKLHTDATSTYVDFIRWGKAEVAAKIGKSIYDIWSIPNDRMVYFDDFNEGCQ